MLATMLQGVRERCPSAKHANYIAVENRVFDGVLELVAKTSGDVDDAYDQGMLFADELKKVVQVQLVVVSVPPTDFGRAVSAGLRLNAIGGLGC